MKRIGIISLFGYNNYGNRLQLYAVQQVYKRLGLLPEIIRYQEETLKEPLKIRLKILFYRMLHLMKSVSESYLKAKRVRVFKKHAKVHYSETIECLNPHRIDRHFHERYSYFSVGSDQIWGWFSHSIASFVFLKFAPKEKRITFSPSFGSSAIGEEYRNVFTDGLQGFENISVREESGAALVKEFTGKSATVLCDPTLCISKTDWLDFASAHEKKPRQKFILTYFLGEPSAEARNILSQQSGEYEVVELNSMNVPDYYAVNPSEWVDYINSAALFLTDSFHGVVFSVIMQTPFVVYRRKGGESMQTRITHILEKFDLIDRFEMNSGHRSLLKVNFEPSQQLAEKEISKAVDFLKAQIQSLAIQV